MDRSSRQPVGGNIMVSALHASGEGRVKRLSI